jgi:molybdopterin-guanine dinucleotide biosynthesis protein A
MTEFLLQLIAVIFAGHSNSRVGVMVTKGCYFVNSETLLHDVWERLYENFGKRLVKMSGKIVVAGATAYLMNRRTDFA